MSIPTVKIAFIKIFSFLAKNTCPKASVCLSLKLRMEGLERYLAIFQLNVVLCCMGLPVYATQASFKYALKTLYTIVELNMIASYFSYFKCGFCMNDGDHLLAPLVCTYQFPHLYMQHTHIHASVGYASNPTARKPIPPPLMLICLASHIDL